jgi:hypothetical protein
MNPALLSALVREREADMLRELQLARAPRATRGHWRRARRSPAPVPVRPRLAPLAGGRSGSPEPESACLSRPAPKPAA